MEFQPFPKLARLNRGMVVTEKIDGTNACVVINDVPPGEGIPTGVAEFPLEGGILRVVGAQSRKRIITPERDNYGFAGWVKDHAEELAQLGPGYHYGEWWGQGIQRGYDLDEKRFSLFNTGRWYDFYDSEVAAPGDPAIGNRTIAPECCRVVPVLATANFSEDVISNTLDVLRTQGSVAAPGFDRPEGVVVYLSAARTSFKVTLENDGVPKSKVAA